MIRLNDAQHRRVKKLTRCHCANNVRGCCLLLDDGEPCVCVQAISYSLLCRYFREAVLPADRELCADLAATADTRKKCELCGKCGCDLEMHHVRKLKDLKGKSHWERLMITKNRKTIALCVDCHQKLHGGKLN